MKFIKLEFFNLLNKYRKTFESIYKELKYLFLTKKCCTGSEKSKIWDPEKNYPGSVSKSKKGSNPGSSTLDARIFQIFMSSELKVFSQTDKFLNCKIYKHLPLLRSS
jgi:hypothetical protein